MCLCWVGTTFSLVVPGKTRCQPDLQWGYVTCLLQDDVCKTEFAANVPFKVISAIFNFYIPTTCMLVLYIRIFLAIKERSRDMEKMTASQGLFLTFQ